MFTRQKKNYRIFVYTALIITICLLIAALLWPQDSEKDGKDNAQVNAQTNTEQDSPAAQPDQDRSGGSSQEEPDTAVTGEDDEKDDISSDQRSYYIVRKDGENVSVFFVDDDGSEVKLEDTDIVYDVLTPDDQHSFDEGITVTNQAELAALLQDFES